MEMRIRQAAEADLPAMVAIKHDAGVAAWPHILPAAVIDQLPFPQRWAESIGSKDARVRVLLAELHGSVVGFAVTRPSGDVDADLATGELDAFFSDPAAWGAGAGRALLAGAVAALGEAGFRHATLWTAAENHRPRRIYEAAGWRVDGMDRHRTFDGVEFVEMRYRIEL